MSSLRKMRGIAVGGLLALAATGISGAQPQTQNGGVGSGVGVYGAGSGIGVYGAGSGIGVYGAGSGIGVYGAGSGVGMYGAGSGVGVYGAGSGIGAPGEENFLQASPPWQSWEAWQSWQAYVNDQYGIQAEDLDAGAVE